MRIRGRHYATGLPVDVVCGDGGIISVTPPAPLRPDAEAGWVAPGLFDLQINGALGTSFTSDGLTVDAVRRVTEVCRRHGVTGCCPTVVTQARETMVRALGALREACEGDRQLARALPAFHLEGPYLSPEDGPRGAHPREHVRTPDWDEFRRFQEAAGGRIRLVTLAPELDGAMSFIERLVAAGIVVALGHTAASAATIRAAIGAGARLSTHLGNGAHARLPRHENYIWEQLAADELWASIICDGHHLTPAVARCILRVKTPGRTILTSDASSLAGLPPGRYADWGREFDVLAEGKVVVPGTPYLAGSWAFTDRCVANAVRVGGVRLHEAIDMAGARPRELLGLPPVGLEPGSPADLMWFNVVDREVHVAGWVAGSEHGPAKS